MLDRAELRRGIRMRQTTDGWRRDGMTPGVRETRVGAPPPKETLTPWGRQGAVPRSSQRHGTAARAAVSLSGAGARSQLGPLGKVRGSQCGRADRD